MGLEASDLSDGAILEKTQQFQNGNGQVQFKITLPSGRELESEWLSPDMKKKAMVQWLDVVKDQAILDADQARAEAREAAMKQRREALDRTSSDAAQAQEPTPENVSTDMQPPSSTGQSLSAPTAGPAAAAASHRQPITSPDDFVAAGLKAAEADYDHWNQVALDAASRLVAAQQNISKWTNIKRSLEGHEQAHSSNASSDNGVNSAGVSPAVRRRRKRASAAAAAAYSGPDATTPYVAHLDARTGKVLDVAPEGPSVPLEQCVADQMAKQPEPAHHGVVTLHVCHPNSAPPMVVEQKQKSEPDRTWRDPTPETLGGRRSITI